MYGGVTRKRQGEGLANCAAHSIGTDGVLCPPRGQGPVLTPHLQLDAIGVLTQIDHIRTTHDLRPKRTSIRLEHPFGVVLRGHQHIRKSGGQPGEVHLELAEHPQPTNPGAGGHQVISEAPRVEQLQRSGVHGERAGEVGLLGTALQYRAAEAGSGKVAGQH